jgi:hypothetical protein
LWAGSLALILGVFFLGQVFVLRNDFAYKLYSPDEFSEKEVFGFAPYWTFSNMEEIDWDVLTTFAYFSLPVNFDGTISKNTYEQVKKPF